MYTIQRAACMHAHIYAMATCVDYLVYYDSEVQDEDCTYNLSDLSLSDDSVGEEDLEESRHTVTAFRQTGDLSVLQL